MKLKHEYIDYMFNWYYQLNATLPDDIEPLADTIEDYWVRRPDDVNLLGVAQILRNWLMVPANLRLNKGQMHIVVRMLLCMACTDEFELDQLQATGYFDELLAAAGISDRLIRQANSVPATPTRQPIKVATMA